MTMDKEEDTSRVNLKRRIKLYQAVAMVAGAVIGTGIYVTPGKVLMGAGSPIAAVVMWLAAGGLSMLGALTYAELATTYPGSGENMHYLNKFFGPFLSFNYSWMYLTLRRPGSNAIKAITTGKYILKLAFPDCSIPVTAVKLIGILLGTVITAINIYNIEIANKIHSCVTAVSVLALTCFSVVGMVYLGEGSLDSWKTGPMETTNDVGDIALTLYMALYAFGGWNSLNFIVEEVKNPNKNVPRAIITAMCAVIFLYVFVNVAYVTVLGRADMIQSEAVAVTFGQRAFPAVAWLVPIVVCFAQISSYNVSNIGASRLMFASSRKNFFPSSFNMVTTWSLSPVTSLLFQVFLVTVYVLIYDVNSMINNLIFLTTLYNQLVLFGFLYERFKYPDLPRPLKMPIVIPCLYTFLNFILLIVPLVTKPMEAVTGALVTAGTGVPVYIIFIAARWRYRQVDAAHGFL